MIESERLAIQNSKEGSELTGHTVRYLYQKQSLCVSHQGET